MIGLIGAGHLGQALLFNWLKYGLYDEKQIMFSTRTENSRNILIQKLSSDGFSGVLGTTDNKLLVSKAKVIVLA
jgi:pyrroline-5-carboxylate reductase